MFLVFFALPFVHCVLAIPGYGSYAYNGHGHRGYNAVGNNYKNQNYYAKPQYAFGYEVDDYYAQLSHGRWEVRDGDVTQGQYRVLLPDGRIQIVSYIADKGGYRPTIQYIGKGVHPPPPPSYVNIKPRKGIPDPYVQQYLPIAPAPPLQLPAIEFGGPTKFNLKPLGIEPVPPKGFQHDNFVGYGGYNGGYHGSDSLLFGPSSKREVKLSPDKISQRRALLYDRTLFRRDIPIPATTPR